MRWAIALGVMLAAGLALADGRADWDSPFHKTAIVETRLGQYEEFEILRAKASGENLEMTKPDGSILLATRTKVVAILPKLPSDGFAYTQKDAQAALALLEEASRRWSNRPETSPSTLSAWKELAARPSPHEREMDTRRGQEVQRWLEMVQPEEGKPKPVDLNDYIQEGERLVLKAGPQADDVRRQIEKVRNLMAIDLGEIRGKPLPSEWNDLGPLIPLGVAVILLILGFWVVGNLGNLSSALKSGVVRRSAKGGENRTSVSLAGVVYLVYVMAGGALLYLLVHATPFPENPVIPDSAQAAAERGIYLSMNAANRWSTQSKSSVEVEAAAVVSVLQKMLPGGEFRLSQVLAYLGPRIAWKDGRIFWRQSFKLAFLPVHLDFQLRPDERNFTLEHPALDGCKLGVVPLGEFLGGLLWNRWQPLTIGWDEALGLQAGAVWSWSKGDLFQIEVPPVTGRKDEKKQAGLAGRQKAKFKESISAMELAQVFAQGDGDVYQDRTINLTGSLQSVSSTRRLGNSLASETTRGALAKSENAVAPKGLEDFPDEFYLKTATENGESKIQVKVLVKCPHVYWLDGRGDLYRADTSPNLHAPVVPRQKQAMFRGGRVEGMGRNVIEVYGAQPPEEAP